VSSVDWCYIELNDGTRGFIKSNYILLGASMDVNPYALPIKLNKDYLVLAKGSNEEIYDTLRTKISWNSENESVAIVDKNGRVYGVNPGWTYIVARRDNKQAKCMVYILNNIGKDAIIKASSLNLLNFNGSAYSSAKNSLEYTYPSNTNNKFSVPLYSQTNVKSGCRVKVIGSLPNSIFNEVYHKDNKSKDYNWYYIELSKEEVLQGPPAQGALSYTGIIEYSGFIEGGVGNKNLQIIYNKLKTPGKYGSIVYEGDEYEIYFPTKEMVNVDIGKKVDAITASNFKVDAWGVAGSMANNENPPIESPKLYTDPGDWYNDKRYINLLSAKDLVFIDSVDTVIKFFTAFQENTTTFSIGFTFTKKGDNRYVTILAGNTHTTFLYNKFSSCRNYNKDATQKQKQKIHDLAVKILKENGLKPVANRTYDGWIQLDTKHIGEKYSSYLWINQNNELMEQPIVHEKDAFYIGFYDIEDNKFVTKLQLDVNLSASIKAIPRYQKLFKDNIE